jgi:hypothetical protein
MRPTSPTSPLARVLLVVLAVSGVLVAMLLVGRAHAEQSRLLAEEDLRTWPTARWSIGPDDFPGEDVVDLERPPVPKDSHLSAIRAVPVIDPLGRYSAFLSEHELAVANDDGAVADRWLRVGRAEVLSSVVQTTRHPAPDPFVGERAPQRERVDAAFESLCHDFRGIARRPAGAALVRLEGADDLCQDEPWLADVPVLAYGGPVTTTGVRGVQIDDVHVVDLPGDLPALDVRWRTTLVTTRVEDAMLLVGVSGPLGAAQDIDAVALLEDLAAQVRADPPTYDA